MSHMRSDGTSTLLFTTNLFLIYVLIAWFSAAAEPFLKEETNNNGFVDDMLIYKTRMLPSTVP